MHMSATLDKHMDDGDWEDMLQSYAEDDGYWAVFDPFLGYTAPTGAGTPPEGARDGDDAHTTNARDGFRWDVV